MWQAACGREDCVVDAEAVVALGVVRAEQDRRKRVCEEKCKSVLRCCDPHTRQTTESELMLKEAEYCLDFVHLQP